MKGCEQRLPRPRPEGCIFRNSICSSLKWARCPQLRAGERGSSGPEICVRFGALLAPGQTAGGGWSEVPLWAWEFLSCGKMQRGLACTALWRWEASDVTPQPGGLGEEPEPRPDLAEKGGNLD